MIRLTVLYDLAPETDEAEFLRWRLSEHQASNLAIEGVVRTDFAHAKGVWPTGLQRPFRFVTTLDWLDWSSFLAGFYAPQVQASLERNLKMLRNPVFLISEVLVNQKNEGSNVEPTA